jgi:uncharacterized protein YecE (DUF72 family)
MKIEERIHIGTSGWRYEHWRGPFYPPELARDEMLAYYSSHLQTVEISCSPYQPPQSETLLRWRDACRSDFTFTVKAHLYISQMTKLKDEVA